MGQRMLSKPIGFTTMEETARKNTKPIGSSGLYGIYEEHGVTITGPCGLKHYLSRAEMVQVGDWLLANASVRPPSPYETP